MARKARNSSKPRFMATGSHVMLVDRRRNKDLGEGTIARFDEAVIAVAHPDGTITMLHGMDDPFFTLRLV